MDEFQASGGSIGSWFTDLAGKFFDYKAKTGGKAGITWFPYGQGGQQMGIDSTGAIIYRGVPAPNAANSAVAGLVQLLPLALIVGGAYFAIRALK